MSDWIPVIINILLLIVTFSTVIYANKTLHAEYSSKVLVSSYNEGLGMNRYYQNYWRVKVENVGKGYVVKAFILLSVRKRKFNVITPKLYYLSKPIIGLYPDEEIELLLELKDEELEKGDFEKAKVKVLYQDSLGNLYSVTPKKKGWNTHLETFDRLPKKMSKIGINYWMYIFRMKISNKQGNTNPGRLRKEMDRKRKLYKKFEEGFSIKPDEDTK